MLILRILGGLLVACGLGLGVAEIFVAGESGFELHALGWWWAEIHRDSLLLLQPAVERHLTPAIWDPGIQTLLEWPAVPQFLVLGTGLWLLGRIGRRKKKRLTFRN